MLCDDWLRSLFDPINILSARKSFSDISRPLYMVNAWEAVIFSEVIIANYFLSPVNSRPFWFGIVSLSFISLDTKQNVVGGFTLLFL